jgi:FKBP-type peptidyl-prolyl cis-trans isomerase (trigger factor)
MQSTLNKAADGTLELTITLPWQTIAATYDVVVEDFVKTAEMPGFRKGKAPKKMVEDSLEKTKVYEEAIKRLVPKAYTDAVEEHKLKPIVMPSIELKDAQEGKDWVILAKTAEKPEVKLGDYKKAVASLKAEKTNKIFVPGKDAPADNPKNAKPKLDELLAKLLTAVTVTIPPMLVEHEVNHSLSQLVDQTKKLGLTVEQYLSSTGRTAESVRKEFADQASRNLTLEFALEAIADAESIVATEEDINKLLATAKSDDERKALANEQYYLSTVVRRQKTLDFLAA